MAECLRMKASDTRTAESLEKEVGQDLALDTPQNFTYLGWLEAESSGDSFRRTRFLEGSTSMKKWSQDFIPISPRKPTSCCG